MKAFLKIIPILLFFFFVFSFIFTEPTFAADDNNIVNTNLFGNFKDDGQGCGIYMLLNIVLDILTFGIGITAVIGITISGITYLTAKGNEQQVVKSKRRIYEIVIGLVVYATLYAGLNFLLPGGKLNPGTQCAPATAHSDYGTKNEWRTRVSDKNDGSKTPGVPLSSGSSLTSSRALNNICKAPSECSWSERIAQTAEALAWPKKTPKSKYDKTVYGRNKCFTSWSQLTKNAKPTRAFEIAYDKVRPTHWKLCSKEWGNGTALGASCDVFAGTVVEYSGYDKNMEFGLYKQTPHLKSSKKWRQVSKPRRGDFCNSNGHSSIYIGKGRVAQAGYGNKSIGGRVWGHVDNGSCGGMRIYRATK